MFSARTIDHFHSIRQVSREASRLPCSLCSQKYDDIDAVLFPTRSDVTNAISATNITTTGQRILTKGLIAILSPLAAAMDSSDLDPIYYMVH